MMSRDPYDTIEAVEKQTTGDSSSAATQPPEPIVQATVADSLVLSVPDADVVAVQVDTMETVQILAPADLPPGYRLQVNVEGRGSLSVEVPGEGARCGEPIQAIVVVDDSLRESPKDHVPIGAWRDGILDCFKLGLFHPVFWSGLLLPPVLLGQVLTKHKMNACVEPHKGKPSKCTAFHTMLVLFVVAAIVFVLLDQLIDCFSGDDENDQGNNLGWSVGISLTRVAVTIFFYAFIFIVAVRTRAFIRKRYKIPSRCGGGCEDVFCTFVCYPCTVCQIARHVTDYEKTQAHCCTSDGLPREPPV